MDNLEQQINKNEIDAVYSTNEILELLWMLLSVLSGDG